MFTLTMMDIHGYSHLYCSESLSDVLQDLVHTVLIGQIINDLIKNHCLIFKIIDLIIIGNVKWDSVEFRNFFTATKSPK